MNYVDLKGRDDSFRAVSVSDSLIITYPTVDVSGGFSVPAQKVNRKRSSQIEVKGPQDPDFSAKDVCPRVRPVGHVDEVVDLRAKHLFELGGNE